MKRLIIITSLFLLIFPMKALATTGSVIQGSVIDVGEDRLNSNPLRTITFLCTGDVTDGSIPDTVLTARNFEKIKGWCFRGVEAYQTTVGSAPDADAASVFVLDAQGMDLLGSEDGGTTPYAGLNLIHATLKRACFGNLYLPRAGLHVNYFTPIKSLLTLRVIDQSTASADWTIVLIFSR